MGPAPVGAGPTASAATPLGVPAGPADALVRISDTRPELRGIALGTQERLSWRASDGLKLDGVLILPPGRPGQTARSPDDDGPRRAQQPVGRRAHAVLGVADPARLGIAGWSHGGFVAAWAVTQTGRFRAAVMGAGITDWAMQVGVGELGRTDAGLTGSFGWEGPGPHRHDQLSPISSAAKVTSPVLILHGEDDSNVPVGQATYFHRALTQFGTEHDLVIYPHENHSFTKRTHQIDVLERARSWFTRWPGRPGDS